MGIRLQLSALMIKQTSSVYRGENAVHNFMVNMLIAAESCKKTNEEKF